jgi:nuclear RNA export factor
VNDTLKVLIEKFVVEYLTLYDTSPSARQQLIPAYDQDGATMTLVLDPQEHPDSGARYSDSQVFNDLRRESHNVMYMDRWERYRNKIVSKGGINVVSKLTQLPPTQHLKDTLLVDVSFAADQLMCFTLQGLLLDGPEAGKMTEAEALQSLTDLRFFTRTFNVIPRGEGIVIVNDILFLTPISPNRAENHIKLLQKAATNSASLQPTQPVPGTSTIVAPQPDLVAATTGVAAVGVASPEQQQAELVERFASASKMKKSWSLKCLQDNEWNFDKAAEMFQQLNNSGSIPGEAFETAL